MHRWSGHHYSTQRGEKGEAPGYRNNAPELSPTPDWFARLANIAKHGRKLSHNLRRELGSLVRNNVLENPVKVEDSLTASGRGVSRAKGNFKRAGLGKVI